MKRSINRLLPFFFAGMFLFAGCATQEVVKKDESLVPATIKPAGTASLNQNTSTAKSPNKPLAAKNETSLPEQKKSQQSNEPAVAGDLQKSLEKIYFDFDSSTLSASARTSLTSNFALLKQNPQSRIRIEGNCDERGSAEYNLALGERRAQAALRYLTTVGIPAERLSAISYGKEKPADPGHDAAAWAKNRRDEFVIAQ
jgi:peptidoglycan-associated lipoprotein